MVVIVLKVLFCIYFLITHPSYIFLARYFFGISLIIFTFREVVTKLENLTFCKVFTSLIRCYSNVQLERKRKWNIPHFLSNFQCGKKQLFNLYFSNNWLMHTRLKTCVHFYFYLWTKYTYNSLLCNKNEIEFPNTAAAQQK